MRLAEIIASNSGAIAKQAQSASFLIYTQKVSRALKQLAERKCKKLSTWKDKVTVSFH